MYKKMICTLANNERIMNRLTKKRLMNFAF